jgi:hypothetical protein
VDFEALFAAIRSTNSDLNRLESYTEAGSRQTTTNSDLKQLESYTEAGPRQTTKQGQEYGQHFAYVNANYDLDVTKLKSASFMKASYSF